MNNALLKVYVKIQCLMMQEEGQDMVEYALVVALIAVGVTATMRTFATTLGTMFTNVGTLVTGAV